MAEKGNDYFYYKAYSFSMQSSFPIPELLPSIQSNTTDVVIKMAPIPGLEDCLQTTSRCIQVNPHQFLLNIDQVAHFLIEDGKSIIIEPYEGVTDVEIRLYLLGSAFGVLMHQRGLLPVHGSAIIHQQKAILFCGRPGIGKSTLAAGFIKKGFKILADDICVVTLDQRNDPMVHPGYPQMKLWTDSLRKLDYQIHPALTSRSKPKKYSLPLNLEFSHDPVGLAGIYIINKGTSGECKISEPLEMNKVNLLSNHIYRQNYMKHMPVNLNPFQVLNRIANLCFVKLVERPTQGFHLEKLIQLIDHDFNN